MESDATFFEQTAQQRVYNWYCWLADQKSPVPRDPYVGGGQQDKDPHNPEDGEWIEKHVMTRFKVVCPRDYEILYSYLRDGLVAAARLRITTETLHNKIQYCYMHIGLMIKRAQAA